MFRALRALHVVIGGLLVVIALGLPTLADALPAQIGAEGYLSGGGGGPIADGKYSLTFSVYKAATGGAPVWSEVQIGVNVTAGHFWVLLGNKTPLSIDALAGDTELWIGVQVFDDPELARVRLVPAPLALVAQRAAVADSLKGGLSGDQLGTASVGPDKVAFTYAGSATKGGPATSAQDLQCTGCVSVSEIAFDADIDLNGNNLLGVTVLSAQTLIGDGSKLTGLKLPTGACEVGQVVTGIQADGKLTCATVAPALPADGLKTISNGVLANQFIDNFPAPGTPTQIKDYFPPGTFSEILVGDVGTAQAFTIGLDITNSDIATLTVNLYDPKNNLIVLYDKGQKGTQLLATYPDPQKPAQGDLSKWVGGNLAGKWILQVVDSGFKDGGYDGTINKWSVNIQTLSNKKVQVQGTLIATGGIGVAKAPSQSCGVDVASTSGGICVDGIPFQAVAYVGSQGDQDKLAKKGQIVYRTDTDDVWMYRKDQWRKLIPPKCGDGLVDEPEVCDGANIMGKKCADVSGSGATGNLACLAGCASFDYSQCTVGGFTGSAILNATTAAQINSWYGNPNAKWTLCYSRTMHGADSSTFHEKCGGKSNAMVVIRTTKDVIFGGFTPVGWTNSKCDYTSGNGAWLYSFKSNAKYTQTNSSYQVYDCGGHTTTFGGGHDIYVDGQVRSGYTNLGHSYSCPFGGNGTPACQTALTGSYNGWQIADLEVFYLN